jgi:hypothetical protein
MMDTMSSLKRSGAGLWLVLAVACESGSAGSASPAPKASTAPAPALSAPGTAAPSSAAAATAAKPEAFGGTFEPSPEVKLPALLANPGAYTDKTVTTAGKVQRACTNKGCWMEIGEGDAACRVTFKDYGFFVPTNSAGAQARVQGRLDTHTIPAARVAHLESEGGSFKNKHADGSVTEVQLIATAVELVR